MEFSAFIESIKEWGKNTDFIKAIILVRSYAKGTGKETSDIDLCILTTAKSELISNPNIFDQFGNSEKVNIEYYGAVTSIRVWYKNGFEVEYGIAETSWIDKPLDPGTQQVLSDGYKIIIDKCDYFKDINQYLSGNCIEKTAVSLP